jgi:hypothetical protein
LSDTETIVAAFDISAADHDPDAAGADDEHIDCSTAVKIASAVAADTADDDPEPPASTTRPNTRPAAATAAPSANSFFVTPVGDRSDGYGAVHTEQTHPAGSPPEWRGRQSLPKISNLKMSTPPLRHRVEILRF